ncbi:helix-turn-helix domain-containing protein [Streptomyces sp. NEAU-S7GS2]|uniref:helix-turn-helix domain-containing protein n=1 Tax=Streptomyces sp. NEAU-S7GS2 TaxID=2202000 RepID=UPI0013A557A2|nr:helix-turn-helix domain-containing protein [Streptomyces sp. NEAU-S7GS2]
MLDAAPDTRSDGAGNVVRRVVDVLLALQTRQQQTGRAVLLREVASQTGLTSGTACRYLQALVSTGRVRQPEPRGAYVLDWLTPAEKPQPSPSQAIRRSLINLQTRTGQTALLYAPFLMGEHPERLAVEMQWGMRPAVDHEALHLAPLGIDPPGQVLAAAMKGPGVRIDAELREIRHAGYAFGPSILDGYDAIAAPVWRGSIAAGAVTLMLARWQMQSPKTRNDCIKAVMDVAGAMSGHLTRNAMRMA